MAAYGDTMKKIMVHLSKTEAEFSAKDWTDEASKQPSFADLSNNLKPFKILTYITNGYKTNQPIALQRLNDEMATLDAQLEHWATNNLPLDKFSKLLTNKTMKSSSSSATLSTSSSSSSTTMSTSKRDSLGSSSNASTGSASTNNNNNSGNSSNSGSNNNGNSGGAGNSLNGSDYKQQQQKHQKLIEQMSNSLNLSDTSENSDGSVTCSYCTISFIDKNELRQHCQTESHQNVIMSDE
ncbi:unnamed protein product, partial [Hermetia illucens]